MQYASSLRLSLLVSLGLIPLSCGGTVLTRGEGEPTSGTGGTGNGVGGSKSPTTPAGPGGTSAVAGRSSTGGGSTGGSSTGGATGTAGSVGAGGTALGGARSFDPAACTKPSYNPLTGLVTCQEGYQHRSKAVACDAAAGAPAAAFPSAEGGAGGEGGTGTDSEPGPLPRADGSVMCNDSSQCQGFAHGYCSIQPQFGPPVCRSGCQVDADCGSGSVCLCGAGDSPTGGACVRAFCRTDDDCGGGALCATYGDPCATEPPFGGGLACLKPEDECRSFNDCNNACYLNTETKARVCASLICGRPFLVEAETRVAPVVTSTAWSAFDRAAPRVDHLSAAERALLAEHWTRMGQMEHASIAAFARFSLQLLALGAPPELVEACHAALADETAHARLCFQLASAYAARPIGPGPLDVSGNLLPTSLRDVVELVIAEGCFGETSAALDALQAAESASDPVIVAAYQRIARDEQRHAELAFRFVRWALQQAPADTAPCIARAIGEPPSRDLGAREIAVPCLEQLLLAANRPTPPRAWQQA